MQGETILCVATDDWDSLWRPIQQTMSRFAPENRVIYFEPGRNPERSVASEFFENLPNYWKLRVRIVQENLFVIPTPSNLPTARRFLPRSLLKLTMPMVNKFNNRILIKQIRKTMGALEIQSPLLWLFDPSQVGLIDKFGEKLSCYHNYDDFPNFTQNNRIQRYLRNQDEELCRQVDLVIATSHSQWEIRKDLNPRTYCVPNGVDFDLFNKAINPETPTPSDISDLKKPVIGYVGWLGYQMDLDLLLDIASTYTDCSIALIGPDAIPKNAKYRLLKKMPNVYFLGRKTLHSLPEYLKVIDVALIPYLLEGYVLTAYPLKLHEYLAAGRAIVTTALPELRPYKNVVRIAETHADFIAKISEAMLDYDPLTIAARVAVAKANTWDSRIVGIYNIIQPLIMESRNPRL